MATPSFINRMTRYGRFKKSHIDDPPKNHVLRSWVDQAIEDFEPLKGIPLVTTRTILVHFQPEIDEFRCALALESKTYQEIVFPLIERYAQKVHLLPASESHHHANAGGLFRHSLDVAIKARRRSDDFLYGREKPPQIREELESAWRLAIGLAGLFHDTGKILTDYRVTDPTGTIFWNPYVDNLESWANRGEYDRYFLNWNPRRVRKHEHANTVLLSELLGPACIHLLTAHDDGPLLALFQTVMGNHGDERFGEIVRWADQTSVALDLKGHRFSTRAAMGKRKDELILEAIKTLILDSVWNTEGANPMLQTEENALLIDWFQAQPSLLRALKEMSPIGWREEADDLADILLERGHAVCPEGQNTGPHRYWIQGQGNRSLRMLKISMPILLETLNIAREPSSIPHEDFKASPIQPPASLNIRIESEMWLRKKAKFDEVWCTLERLNDYPDLAGIRLIKDQIWVPYPDAFYALELPPIPSLKLFQDSGMLQLDDRTGMRAVLEIEGERGCLFTAESSNHILAIWPLGPKDSETNHLEALSSSAHTSAVRNPKTPSIDTSQLFSPERLRAIARVPNAK